MKGIDLLVEICTRYDLFENQSIWDKAVEDLRQHGEEGSKALASLLNEMLRCRADKIGPVIAAAKKLSPVPELISALEAVKSAPPLTLTIPGARFRPEIAGEGKIGWTDRTAADFKELASETLKALRSSQ